MYKTYFKRLIDILISFSALLILSPIIATLMVLLKINNKTRVFFLQERPGLHGRIFKVIKFKTMTDEKDQNGKLLSDADRLTPFGRFVRAASLDELPQLINVLKGDMSLVGPRPLLVKYLPLYNDFQKRRHEVKPGVTGWAQVNGRNSISWNKKFEMDIWYVDHLSLLLDLRIILLTVKKVIIRDGINSSIDVPMETFKGNQ